jgi:hypothetical protein
VAIGLGALAGGGFYTVREIMDWWGPKGDGRVLEGLTRFDWPGFLWPVISVAVAWGVAGAAFR